LYAVLKGDHSEEDLKFGSAKIAGRNARDQKVIGRELTENEGRVYSDGTRRGYSAVQPFEYFKERSHQARKKSMTGRGG